MKLRYCIVQYVLIMLSPDRSLLKRETRSESKHPIYNKPSAGSISHSIRSFPTRSIKYALGQSDIQWRILSQSLVHTFLKHTTSGFCQAESSIRTSLDPYMSIEHLQGVSNQ